MRRSVPRASCDITREDGVADAATCWTQADGVGRCSTKAEAERAERANMASAQGRNRAPLRRHQGALSRLAVSGGFEVGGASPRAFSRDIMAPKRKAPEEENDAPPAFLLKTKRFVVNLARIKGSMGLGIDDQHTAMFKARWRRLGPAGAPEATVSARSSRWLPQAPASLRQSAARSALAGHIGLLFDAGIT